MLPNLNSAAGDFFGISLQCNEFYTVRSEKYQSNNVISNCVFQHNYEKNHVANSQEFLENFKFSRKNLENFEIQNLRILTECVRKKKIYTRKNNLILILNI